MLVLYGQKFMWNKYVCMSFCQLHGNCTLAVFETPKRREKFSHILPQYSRHELVTEWSRASN